MSERDKLLSRRDFAIGTVVAGLAVGGADAMPARAVTARSVEVPTKDGQCDAWLVHPEQPRPAPGVIFFPDFFGLRPVKIDMARRLAAHGYAVLVVNQFYRLGKAPVLPPGFNFADPAGMARGMRMIDDLDHERVTRDALAFAAFLDAAPEVDRRKKMGVVGFCMGGPMAIRAAAALPDRVGAVVSFHGGRLVTDEATSPHKLIAGTKAAYHIAIAADDDEKEPETRTILDRALASAARLYTIEVYAGAKHGWMVPDMPVYDERQAERGWAAMLGLYGKALA